jgi:hypothetical protein
LESYEEFVADEVEREYEEHEQAMAGMEMDPDAMEE